MKNRIYIITIVSLLIATVSVSGKPNLKITFFDCINSSTNSLFNSDNFIDVKNLNNKHYKNHQYSNMNIGINAVTKGEGIKGISSDYPKAGNLNYPSYRKKNQWKDSEEDEIDGQEIKSLNAKKQYKSTIAKIRATEKNLNVKEQKFSWVNKINEDDYMEIFMSGGGFKNGVDARLHDRIIVNNAGYVQSYYESEISGVRKTEKVVDKEDLAEFIKWIAEKGFFEFDKEYECEQSDKGCYNRLSRHPQPIPLKIVVAIGERRNVVVVPIFAPDIEKNYVNYPKELKQIVEAIYLFASL